MLRQIFKSLIVARQASAAFETLSHLSDRQLQDIGFTRATYVDEIKAQVLVKMDDADEKKASTHRSLEVIATGEGLRLIAF